VAYLIVNTGFFVPISELCHDNVSIETLAFDNSVFLLVQREEYGSLLVM